MRRFFVEITLDASAEDSNNEDDAQLNTQTDDDQLTKRPADQPTTMEITPDHPVYVEGKGWLWAENLALGDRLRRSDGGMAKVLAVERVKLAEPQVVYNFTVKGPHTYFVLEVGVLVHNAGVCNPDDYPHLLEELQRGGFRQGSIFEPENQGFSLNQSREIVQRLSKAGVTDEQLKMLDDLYANATIIEKNGVKLAVINNNGVEEVLIWRIADKGKLDSIFSKLNQPSRQQKIDFSALMVTGPRKNLKTDYDKFLAESAYRHAEKAQKSQFGSPWVSTGAHLAPIVKTTDTALLRDTVTKSDTIHVLQVPSSRLNFNHITSVSETEVLALVIDQPLDPHLVIGLPNIFHDEAFTNKLRGR